MHRATINRRLSALEQQAAPPPLPCAVILRWPCGKCQHNGEKYGTLAMLLDAVKPADFVVADVMDYRKPQTKAQGGQ